jgi:putative peptidoglycan lipid II flippase
VILPRLAQQEAAGDHEGFARTIDWALRWVLLIGVPAAIGLGVLAGPIVATLFLSDGTAGEAAGGFGVQDARMTGLSLSAYAGGLLGLLGVRVLAPAYYARERMRAPVRVALLAVALNALLSLALMGPLGHVGLALATSLAAFANAALLLRGLLRDGTYRPTAGWGPLLARVLAAGSAMGLLLVLGAADLSTWTAMGQGQRIVRLALWVLAGAAAYGGALLITGLRPRQLRRQDV